MPSKTCQRSIEALLRGKLSLKILESFYHFFPSVILDLLAANFLPHAENKYKKFLNNHFLSLQIEVNFSEHCFQPLPFMKKNCALHF